MNIQQIFSVFSLFFFSIIAFAQQENDSIKNLEEVIIKSQRIALPFSKNSHTISIVTAKDIKNMSVTTLDEVLQQITGVDVRRRGIEGMQSDLYIRGGNFNQTLLLIDGICLNDMQTGHHNMNGIIAIENIERIEVIKGAASRIYGQNAMNGAINMVTKKPKKEKAFVNIKLGSFESYGVGIGFNKLIDNGSVQFYVDKLQSKGYRYNTDFDNLNAFFKTNWKDYELLASFSQRDFGANGFYSAAYLDQYEETQTHLLAVKKKFKLSNILFHTNVYWRNNQDMYLLYRNDPLVYKNEHTNNKVGFSVNTTVSNRLGITGLGIDINKGFLKSNNLGNHQRFTTTAFLEHRFQFFDHKLDIKPGVAFAYYSDFDFYSFPGVDVGYRFSDKFKLYFNSGYTYRMPTYTNLYYLSDILIGNSNLKPEQALNYEGGLFYKNKNTHLNFAYFLRKSTDVIDWVKENEADPWQASSIDEIETKGFELTSDYNFKLNKFSQKIGLGYTFLDNNLNDLNVNFSRYTLNSYVHQFNTQLTTQFISFLKQHISYRYNERVNGASYHLLDFALSTNLKKWKFSIKANNILNTAYTETNLVPMPKFNGNVEISYIF